MEETRQERRRREEPAHEAQGDGKTASETGRFCGTERLPYFPETREAIRRELRALEWNIEPASPSDLDDARKLLDESGLPAAGLLDQWPQAYAVVKRSERIVGLAGLERYGTFGLLRSLAVDPALRSLGLGARLLQDRMHAASRDRLERVYLLTTSAAEFFRRHGFTDADRAGAPAEIRSSPEFAHVCPVSAACLTRIPEVHDAR
jgi:amino-acid N-acetyltransferase